MKILISSVDTVADNILKPAAIDALQENYGHYGQNYGTWQKRDPT